MPDKNRPVRVLYSFPHKLGASRICYTAWQQVKGLAAMGVEVLACPGVLHRPVPDVVKVVPTLSHGRLRIPYKLVGKLRALSIHDFVVSRRIEKLARQIDIIHTWPMAAVRTLNVARRLGIPTVLERPNANTRFAYNVVRDECKRLGVSLPPGHEYEFNEGILRQEEEEYRLADYILCASDFTVKTFLDQGFEREKLIRHQYGYDEKTCYPAANHTMQPNRGLTMLFAGECAVRKGVHFALEAWLRSPAHRDGTFVIAGTFMPAYAKRLHSMLSHPSIRVVGHRTDLPDLMRESDLFVLPSIEEGFGLVIAEAMGSGCVTLASEACTEICRHMETGLVHPVGNVEELTKHITLLYEDRVLLRTLRAASLSAAQHFTWGAAGSKLLEVYREVIARSDQAYLVAAEASGRR